MKIEEAKLIARFLDLKPHQINESTWGMSDTPWWSVTGKTAKEVFEISLDKFRHDKDMNTLMKLFDRIENLGYTVKTLSTPTISGRWYMHNIAIENYRVVCCKVESNYSVGETKISTWFRGCIGFLEWYYKNVEVVEQV